MSNTPATRPGNAVAVPNTGLPEGLEDTEATDLTMPIFKIDHEKGVFIDSLTNEELPAFKAILLGRIKQRILWPMDQGGGGEQPMCRSYDFQTGIPRPATWTQPQKNNPKLTAVKLSGWTFDQVEEAAEGDGLNCGSCPLKDWGSDRTPPWCNEQWTFPFLRPTDDGEFIPGLISFQRTGLKPCKSYVNGFVQAKSALYTVVTEIRAVVQEKGTVQWVVPSFRRIEDTDTTDWPQFSTALHQIKEFITTPRVFTVPEDDDADDIEEATVVTATVSKPKPAAAAPKPQPAAAPVEATVTEEVVVESDEEPAVADEQIPAPVTRAEPAAEPAAPAADEYDPDEEPF